MARFIPAVDSTRIPHPSEQLVYEALAGLPDDYVVMHSFPWLRPQRNDADEPLREGEADFLILHRERGLLVVEVKGGEPQLRERSWFRGRKPMRDPFEQARRNRYALLDAVEERTRGKVHRRLFSHGDAVVFPQCRYEGHLPVSTEARIFLDSASLCEMPARIEGAFAAWNRERRALTVSEFTGLIDALMPKLRLLRCASLQVEVEAQRILQITLDQRATLVGLLENARVLVQGTAGSGKTLLALDFARTLAAQGERVLFLCFNRHLAAWIQEQAEANEAPSVGTSPGDLEVATFHSYALSLARSAGVEFAVPSTNAQSFWDDEVPLILEQALDVLRTEERAPAFDTVVVDEAQDFAPDWWVTVESLSDRGPAGRLYAFLDLQQSLRGDARLPPLSFGARFRLGTNCRNTRRIARTAASLATVEVTILPGSPEGETPDLRRATAPNAQAGIVLNEVRTLLNDGFKPSQIAVIGPASHEQGSLRGHRSVDETPLVVDAAAWRLGDGVLVTTARAFKGLEADVVVVHDLNAFSPFFSKTDLYVAWTRARHRLVLVSTGAAARAVVEAALADSEMADTS